MGVRVLSQEYGGFKVTEKRNLKRLHGPKEFEETVKLRYYRMEIL
jgi:hypothetical protein